MEFDAHLDALRQDTSAVADVADAGDLDAPVPGCPGFDVADVVEHLGNADWWAREQLSRGDLDRVRLRDRPATPPRDELAGWYRTRAVSLVDMLVEVGPDAPAWTLLGSGRSSFWARRQAHETSIHHWDLARAIGSASAIDADLASDGIDEFLMVFGQRGGDANTERRAQLVDRVGASVHLHCTDVNGEWLVTVTHDVFEIERQHAKGDVAARGRAEDLLLHLWGRTGTDVLEVFGDASLLERVRAAIVV